MKRIIVRILLCALCLLLVCLFAVGCDDPESGGDVTESESTAAPEESDGEAASEDTEAPEPEVEADTAYLQLSRRRVVAYKELSFFFEEDEMMLTLTVPQKWMIKADGENGYAFLSAGKEIAHLYMDAVTPKGVVAVKSAENGDLKTTRTLTSLGESASLEKRYAYCVAYSYADGNRNRTVTLRVGYTELDTTAEEYLLTEARTELRCRGLGMLSDVSLRKNAPIMVLGNSFVNTSQVANIAGRMLSGTSYNVQGISIGYAEVSRSWSDYLEPMKRGSYAAVFMCGFYGQDDVDTFAQYVEACAQSNTPLIVFPAHNEGFGAAAAAKYDEYEHVYFLDWKGELDDLLAAGVPESLLCINDAHKHSTELAGYVGAHMIYRALTGKLPSSFGGISQTLVQNGLGDYHTRGYTDAADGKTRFLLPS